MSHLVPALRRSLLSLLLALIVATVVAPSAFAQVPGTTDVDDAATVIDILPVEGFIDPPVAAQITDVIAGANERGSDLVVLQVTSAGVVSADVDALLRTIRESAVPVAVFVGPRAAGAELQGGGGLLLAAAHVRAAAVDATIGPFLPLDLGDDGDDGGGDGGDARPREFLTHTLPELWEASQTTEVGGGMLAARLPVEAFTAEQIAGAFDVLANGLEPLFVELDGVTVTTVGGEETLRIRRDEVGVRFHSLGLVRRMLHAATTPAFIYLLLVIGLAMLLFEVFQPGFGVAGIAGIIMAGIGIFGLTVLPVAWWAVALIAVGLALFAVDVAVAGFGPVTLAATASFAAGSWWLYPSETLHLPGWLVALTTLTALVFFVIVMTMVLRAQAGPEHLEVGDLVGKAGIVRSVLNPEGHVYIDGALWRARWTGEAKRAKVGTPVRVHGVDGPVILVAPFDPGEEPAPADAGAASDAPQG